MTVNVNIHEAKTHVAIGGMSGEIRFADADFDELDPDIQLMFYGDEQGEGAATR